MEKRYPITMMCSACIPWTKDFLFDEKTFRSQVASLTGNKVKSIFIMGTAGEGYALNTQMYTQVVTAFLDECSKFSDVMPMTGIISTAMPEMIERIGIAYKLGCRDFQIAFPCWGALNDKEVSLFFKTICGAYPDCRFIHYNNGPRSKTKLSVSQYKKLAEEIPNLVAVKYSTPSIYEIYDIATANLPLSFYLVDMSYTFGAMYGDVGLLSSSACLDFDIAWQYFEAGQTKNYEKLRLIGEYIIEITKILLKVEGTFIDSAYDKSMERVADSSFSNALYPPYIGISEEDFVIIDSSMKKLIEKYRGLVLNK